MLVPVVEYYPSLPIGEPVSFTSSGHPALGRGLSGTWSLTAGGWDSGRWHLWPVMARVNDDAWDDDDATNSSAGNGESACEGEDGEREAEGWLGEDECCACMNSGIDARLEPCGKRTSTTTINAIHVHY